MGYKNGGVLLPAELLRQVQRYVDGESIYIPRRAGGKKKWGEKTALRAQLAQRDAEIRQKHEDGMSVKQLSETYYISPQRIYKILSDGN